MTMKKLTKFALLLIVTLSMAVSTQSCDDDEYIWGEPGWWDGQSYIATDASGTFNWILDMYGDGTFYVTPYDFDGYEIYDIEAYSGLYTVDYNQNIIYVSYTGYSMNSMWYINYPGGYNMTISTPVGYGPLDNLVFQPY